MADTDLTLIELTADVVASYVSNTKLQPGELPVLIRAVHAALQNVDVPVKQPNERPAPAVPIKKSVTPEHLISLFDGRKFRSLKRYLATSHNMTANDYRTYWGLPKDYPMVAPAYAAKRSELAKAFGLGQGARKAAVPPPAKRSRKPKVEQGGQ